MLRKILLFSLFFLFSVIQFVYGQWIPQNVGTNQFFRCVHFASPTTGWMTGNSGLILKTTNGGDTWFQQTSPFVNAMPQVFSIDTLTAYIAVHNGYILKTTNGGTNWNIINTGTSSNITSLYFLNANIGWAAGYNETILKTTNGGLSWSLYSTGGTKTFTAITFSDQNTGFVVGTAGRLLITTDGGASWQTRNLGVQDWFFGVDFVSSTTGFIVGGLTGTHQVIFKTTDRGATWQSKQPTSAKFLINICHSDNRTLWACGYDGIISRSLDEGETWTEDISNTTNELDWITQKPGYPAFAVGANGTVLRYGGNRFIMITSPMGGELWPVGTNHTITWQSYGVTAVKIEYSTDLGQNWITIADSTLSNGIYQWIVPNTLSASCKVKITDITSMNNFAVSPQPFSIIPPQPYGWSVQASGTPQLLRCGKFGSATTGWVIGNGGVILKTTNNGISWFSQASGTTAALSQIWIFDSLRAYIAGYSGIFLKTTNGGNNWVSVPTNTGSNLTSLYFFDNNNGVLAGYNGMILSTTNGGTTWIQRYIPYSDIITGLWFTDKQTGFVIGPNGAMYKTSDGGITWVNKNFNTINWLFGIDFVSSKIGFIVGGYTGVNQAIYKTMDGGSTWTIKSTPSNKFLTHLTHTDENHLWGCGYKGEIMYSSDQGETWVSQNSSTTQELDWVFMTNSLDGFAVGMNGAITRYSNYQSTSSVSITSPVGGEEWEPLSQHYIRWNSFNVSNVKLEFSINGGESWSLITPSTPADSGFYYWTVPNIITNQALVKISDVNNSLAFDISDGVFNISFSQILSVPMQMIAGWNMVSVPVLAQDMSATALFAGANSSVFSYSSAGGYTPQTLLTGEKGYWVRYANAANFSIVGTAFTGTTIPLLAGWNLIGGHHLSIPVGNLTTTPPNIINSMYFAYNNGYLQANDLQPGKAYWVRATQAGVINLPPKNSPENNTADNRIENGWTKIIITDAAGNTMTLYGLPSVQAGFDLPPVPPAGIFDVRFEGDKLADVISSVKDIRVTGAVYPITIRVEGAEITLRDKETAGKLLNQIIVPGKTVQITNSSVNIIEVSSTMKPTAYELSQNYPNPFNPTTVINFQIPQAGLVSLKVYDAIGTEAATLVNEQKEAGSYSVTFDASRLHSGVYFYTLRSGDFTATKKLLLVK